MPLPFPFAGKTEWDGGNDNQNHLTHRSEDQGENEKTLLMHCEAANCMEDEAGTFHRVRTGCGRLAGSRGVRDKNCIRSTRSLTALMCQRDTLLQLPLRICELWRRKTA